MIDQRDEPESPKVNKNFFINAKPYQIESSSDSMSSFGGISLGSSSHASIEPTTAIKNRRRWV